VKTFSDVHRIRYVIRNSAAFQFLNGVFCILARTKLAWRYFPGCVTILIVSRQSGVTLFLHRY